MYDGELLCHLVTPSEKRKSRNPMRTPRVVKFVGGSALEVEPVVFLHLVSIQLDPQARTLWYTEMAFFIDNRLGNNVIYLIMVVAVDGMAQGRQRCREMDHRRR